MTRGLFHEAKPFPGQDPWIVPFEDSLLLVQSADRNRKIVIKRFTDLGRMHRFDETVVWTPPSQSDHGRQIWAPELHEIGHRWYLYFAASDGRNRNHRMYALEADHPLGPYHEVGKVFDPAHDGWAIDLTVLTHAGQLYALWSGWEEAGDDDDCSQSLFIAPMSTPWSIAGERRLISRPEHDWETSVAAINEGPEVLRGADGKLFIVYSADASWTNAYKMGVLEWTGDDVMDPAAWTKRPTPIFSGGGHGCFVETSSGTHVVYHRKLTPDPGWSDRVIRCESLSWDPHGLPVIGDPSVAAATKRSAPHGAATMTLAPTADSAA